MFDTPHLTTNMSFASPTELPAVEPTQDIPVSLGPDVTGTPQPAPIPNVYAFVKEIVPAGNNTAENSELEFDVILNVSCGEGGSTTIIKKIKFCKYQLAQEMQDIRAHSPVTMVENIAQIDNEAEITMKRLRELSGIPHSKNFV